MSSPTELSIIDKTTLTEAINQVLEDEGRVTAALVPGVQQFSGNDEARMERYHLREQIERARRIWATADTNARALAAMLGEDYDAARIWAEYLATEMSRDRLYLSDLAKHGIEPEQVRATPPFRSTIAMIETMVRNIAAMGSLPAVAYSVFVEWNSARASREGVAPTVIKGTAAHADIDQREDRTSQMIEVAHRLVTGRPDAVPVFLSLLRQTSAFFRAYLAELHAVSSIEAATPRTPRTPPKQPKT